MLQQGRTLYEPAIKHDTMKVGYSMLALLSIFVIILSIHDASAQTEKIDEKNIDNLHYENDEIGVALEYFPDWKLVEDIQNVPFVLGSWSKRIDLNGSHLS